eukprot:GILJ01001452.1.p1 GENE.GILJ01001452.1~~GILJ01001452.1.p1  ORF type:complete len:230 (+),score=33.76 GILJ01001452.1:102-791(+)
MPSKVDTCKEPARPKEAFAEKPSTALLSGPTHSKKTLLVGGLMVMFSFVLLIPSIVLDMWAWEEMYMESSDLKRVIYRKNDIFISSVDGSSESYTSYDEMMETSCPWPYDLHVAFCHNSKTWQTAMQVNFALAMSGFACMGVVLLLLAFGLKKGPKAPAAFHIASAVFSSLGGILFVAQFSNILYISSHSERTQPEPYMSCILLIIGAFLFLFSAIPIGLAKRFAAQKK